jgi:glutathione S-transferase
VTAPATLYHCVGARSLRPLWALEELQLPYELKVLPFPPRAHGKTYFAINPTGTVPTYLENGLRLTESVAICEYLAARHDPGGLAVRSDEPEYGPYLDWLHFGETTLTYPLTIALRYARFEAAERRLPQAVEDYTRLFLARLRPVAAALEARDHLCAHRFTVADISVGYALMLAETVGLREHLPDAVRAYRDRLGKRAGFERARAAEASAAAAATIVPPRRA